MLKCNKHCRRVLLIGNQKKKLKNQKKKKNYCQVDKPVWKYRSINVVWPCCEIAGGDLSEPG